MHYGLVRSYADYCKRKKKLIEEGTLDLSDLDWIYPTLLLPLDEILANEEIVYEEPRSRSVCDYISWMRSAASAIPTDSYIPIMKSKMFSDTDLQHMYNLVGTGRLHENTLKEIMGELVTNIQEHSKCSNSIFMVQKYTRKGFLEMAFFDNGRTIAGSFRECGFYKTDLEDLDYIKLAISGNSTKGVADRGHGLPNTINITNAGLLGDILIVSGKGAFYIEGSDREPKESTHYKLNELQSLGGTLIALRIPLPIKDIDVYDYIK